MTSLESKKNARILKHIRKEIIKFEGKPAIVGLCYADILEIGYT